MLSTGLSGSKIEELANRAVGLAPYGGFNLVNARRELTELMSAIGRTTQFATYTKHDISHIDSMLSAIDWLVPESTMSKLTVADALVITLSVYVHDLGMLVTKNEYSKRATSGFPQFKEDLLEDATPRGIDFRERLSVLPEPEHEEFLYEEFVRTFHAERIEAWVGGKPHTHLGVATEAATLVRQALSGLDATILSDVALVARSHHLSDLNDLSKYKVNRSYGTDAQDTVNLQYAAIILRSGDLLHITRDRTPIVQYRLASPSDPMGQREWRKQMAVRAVKPSASQPSSIEVHASFEQAEGFFALMEYLDYCETEMQQSNGWCQSTVSAHPHLGHYIFPWTEIDRDEVEAVGFERSRFAFTFDQEKVLELLTGHTLYNDAGVAIRELVQNSIDAVRLQAIAGGPADFSGPQVRIQFDSKTRTISVLDRGTGMSQQVIEDHFLRVGSSRYQSESFKKSNPEFTSISRFGIGVLSAFMVADEVEVATITSGEQFGRVLSLKSVHGTYLIRNFAHDDDEFRALAGRGTRITMRLRPSSDLDSRLLDLLRKWIVVPGCLIDCTEDGKAPVQVGASSATEALKAVLQQVMGTVETRVRTAKIDGAEIAIAQRWNATFREWEAIPASFIESRRNSQHRNRARQISAAGVCIQGVRVTESVPGFTEAGPMALIDVTGPGAPITNVARSDLEAGQPLNKLVRSIYSCAIEAIVEQIPAIAGQTSLRMALKEAAHLYTQFAEADQSSTVTKAGPFREVINSAALHAVETSGEIQASSVLKLKESGFDVLVGPAAEDAARFLDWLPKPQGLLNVLRSGGLLNDLGEAPRPLLGDFSALSAYDSLLWEQFEPVKVKALESGKSLLMSLEAVAGRWSQFGEFDDEIIRSFRDLTRPVDRQREGWALQSRYTSLFAVDAEVQLEGLDEFDVTFVGMFRLFGPGTLATRTFERVTGRFAEEPNTGAQLAALFFLTNLIAPTSLRMNKNQTHVDDAISWLTERPATEVPDRDLLIEFANTVSDARGWSSSLAWRRRGDSQM